RRGPRTVRVCAAPARATSLCLSFCPTAPLPPEIYSLSLHDALPIFSVPGGLADDDRVAVGLFLPLPVDRAALRQELAADALLHRSEEHTSELQSRFDLVCRLLLEKKKPLSLIGLIDAQAAWHAHAYA